MAMASCPISPASLIRFCTSLSASFALILVCRCSSTRLSGALSVRFFSFVRFRSKAIIVSSRAKLSSRILPFTFKALTFFSLPFNSLISSASLITLHRIESRSSVILNVNSCLPFLSSRTSIPKIRPSTVTNFSSSSKESIARGVSFISFPNRTISSANDSAGLFSTCFCIGACTDTEDIICGSDFLISGGFIAPSCSRRTINFSCRISSKRTLACRVNCILCKNRIPISCPIQIVISTSSESICQ